MLEIKWNEEKCCHTGVCVNSLPEVFKIENGAFRIDPEAAKPERIRKVVAQCPTGALSIEEQ